MTAPVILDLQFVGFTPNGAIHVAREGTDPADGCFLWPTRGEVASFDVTGTRVRVVVDAGLARERGLCT